MTETHFNRFLICEKPNCTIVYKNLESRQQNASLKQSLFKKCHMQM